jgi:LmbE family N-acetylglucosaminyl deacetylase
MLWSARMRPKATEALVKLRSANQAHVNRTYYADGANMAEVAIRALIEAEQVDAPFFGRHDWVLAEVTGLVAWRGTTYAKPADVVLVTQDLAGVVSFYSVREAALCVAGAGIRPYMGWDEAFVFWRKKAGKGTEAPLVVSEPEAEGPPIGPSDWEPPLPEQGDEEHKDE